MHIPDPNGSIKAYRQERDRRELIRTVTFTALTIVAAIVLVAAYNITLAMLNK